MFNWASTCPSPHVITPLTTRLTLPTQQSAAPPKFSKWNAFDWSYQEWNKCIYFYDLMIEKNKHSFSTQCDVSPVAGQPWWKVAIFSKKCRSLPFMAKPNWEIHRSPVRYRSFGWRNEDCGSGGCFGLRWYRDISSNIRHVTTQVVSHWKLPHSMGKNTRASMQGVFETSLQRKMLGREIVWGQFPHKRPWYDTGHEWIKYSTAYEKIAFQWLKDRS